MSWAIANHIDRGIAADRPAAGAVPGKHYGWFSTDTGVLSVSDGSSWIEIGPFDDSALQPLDADLSAIAALTTTSFGRSLLELANSAALLAAAGADAAGAAAAAQAASQPLDADLTALADLNAATGKTTPVDADLLPVADSAASFAIKKLTWANLKATLKAYTDTLYTAIGASAPPNGSAGGDLTGTYPNPTLAAAGPGATGPIGGANTVPVVTIDAKGRVTALTSATPALGFVMVGLG